MYPDNCAALSGFLLHGKQSIHAAGKEDPAKQRSYLDT
jgi:hypothetical protein